MQKKPGGPRRGTSPWNRQSSPTANTSVMGVGARCKSCSPEIDRETHARTRDRQKRRHPGPICRSEQQAGREGLSRTRHPEGETSIDKTRPIWTITGVQSVSLTYLENHVQTLLERAGLGPGEVCVFRKGTRAVSKPPEQRLPRVESFSMRRRLCRQGGHYGYFPHPYRPR